MRIFLYQKTPTHRNYLFRGNRWIVRLKWEWTNKYVFCVVRALDFQSFDNNTLKNRMNWVTTSHTPSLSLFLSLSRFLSFFFLPLCTNNEQQQKSARKKLTVQNDGVLRKLVSSLLCLTTIHTASMNMIIVELTLCASYTIQYFSYRGLFSILRLLLSSFRLVDATTVVCFSLDSFVPIQLNYCAFVVVGALVGVIKLLACFCFDYSVLLSCSDV